MDGINNLMSRIDVAQMKKDHCAQWMPLHDRFLQIIEELRVLLTDNQSLGYDSNWFKTGQDIFKICRIYMDAF